MPSRPMFTTPARSENRPPRPASPIGTASSSAAAIVDDDVRACSPLISRTTASRTSTPASSSQHAARPAAAGEQGGDRRCGSGRASGVVSGRAHACTPWRSSVDSPCGVVAAGPGHRGDRRTARPRSARAGAGDPAGDLVGDDHREHDRALDDRDHRRGEVCDLQRHQRAVEEGEQQRGQGDADRACCGRAARPRCRGSRGPR